MCMCVCVYVYVCVCVQTKHFLLIGFLGMFIGSIVFSFLSLKKKENKMQVRVLSPSLTWCLQGLFLGSGALSESHRAGDCAIVEAACHIDALRTLSATLMLGVCLSLAY